MMTGPGSSSGNGVAIKPLVFVPGFPGSAIEDVTQKPAQELFPDLGALLSTTLRPTLVAKLAGPDDLAADDGVKAGEVIRTLSRLLVIPFVDLVGEVKQAQSLYDILAELGYTEPFGARFRPVGWDWRRPVDDPAACAAVSAAIKELHAATGEQVTLLCHSTGGLVVRATLEKMPDLVPLVERVIALVVPWAGTLQSFPYLAHQEAFAPFTGDETQSVVGRSWAAYDLLPPNPATTDMTDAEGDLGFFSTAGQSNASPLIAADWMAQAAVGGDLTAMQARAASSNARLGKRQRTLDLGANGPLEVVAVAGFGASTTTGCVMDAFGKVTFLSTDDGDGTIPRRSAAWLAEAGSRTFFVPVGHYPNDQLERVHICIWENQPVQDLLGVLLAQRPWQPYTYAAVDADDAINDVPKVRVRLVAQDQNGRPLTGAVAQAGGLDGAPPEPVLVDQGSGRGLMLVEREKIVTAVGDGAYRFTVQFHWQEGGQDRSGAAQALLVRKAY